MTRIFLIAVFAGMFVGCSLGQECENQGNETLFRIENCDRASFRKLVRSFGARNIVQLKTSWRNQNNRFQTIDAELFKGMRNLVELKLNECGIENIAEDTFSRLKFLRILNLSYNRKINKIKHMEIIHI
jgi:hypothetical protein